MQLNAWSLFSPALEHIIDRHPLKVTPDTSVLDVITLMGQVQESCMLPGLNSSPEAARADFTHASCVLVMEGRQLAGVFTERDVVRITAAGMNLTGMTIASVSGRSPITLAQSDFQDIFTVLSLFRQHRIRHLPVLDAQGQLLGVVTPEGVRRVLQPANLLQLRRVAEAMTTSVIDAPVTTSVLDLARLMSEHQVSCVVITERAESTECSARSSGLFESSPLTPYPSPLQPIGIVTERDIVQFQALELNLSQTQAQTVMSTPLFCLSPQDSLWTVHQEMQRRHVRRFVVSGSRGELLGIVTQTSLLQTLDPTEIYKLVDLLQQSVEDRTAELQIANQQLQNEIAEHQRSQTLMKQAEAKYQSIFESAIDGIFQTSPDGHYLSVNPALAQIYGYESPADLERNLTNIEQQLYVIPDRRTEFMQRLQEHDTISEFESQVYRKDGSIIWIVENARAVRDQGGSLLYYEGTVKDISDRKRTEAALHNANTELGIKVCERSTELSQAIERLQQEIVTRKRAEQALSEREAQYRSVVDALQEGVTLLDADGRICTCNASAANILGLTVEQIIGKTFLDLWEHAIHEDGFPFPSEIHPAMVSLSTGRPYSNVIMGIYQPNGTLVWISINSQPLFRAGETTPYAVVASLCDITKRKQVEEQLAKSKERYRVISELTSDFAYAMQLRPDSNLLVPDWITGAFSRISGFTAADLKGNVGWLTLIHPQDRPRMSQRTQILLSGQSDVSEYRIITQNGEIRWLRDYACPAKCDRQAHVSVIYGAAQDITASKQAAEALQHQTLRSQLFAEITLKIRQSLQIGEILQTTVTEVRELLQVDRVLIYRLCSDGTGSVETEAVVPAWPSLVGMTFAAEVFPAEYHELYRQGRMEAIANVEQATLSPCHTTFLQQLQVQAKLVVPILRGNTLWGLLIVHQCSGPRQWLQFESELLQQLANQVSIALAQAELVEALQISENRYRSVVDNAQEIIFQVDAAGFWTFLNPAWARITGFSTGDSIGTNSLNYVHPDDRQYQLELFQTLIKHQQEAARREVRYLTRDGKVRWLEAHAQSILSSDHTIVGISGILNDITERKQVEAELLRISKAVESASDAIGIADVTGRSIYHNKAFLDLFEYTAEGLNSNEGPTAIYADPQVARTVFATITNGNSWRGEVEMHTRQGRAVTISLRADAIKDEQNHIIGLIGVHTDITERKQAEKALQKSEARFQKMAANVPGMIYQFLLCSDGSCSFPFVSSSCRELYELEPDEIQNDASLIINIIHLEDRQQFKDSIAASAQTLQPWHWEGRVILPSGQRKWLQGASRPEKQANGDILWDGLILDITERKQVEAEVQRQHLRSQLVAEITLKIRQSLQIEEILQTTVTEVRELLQADRVLLFRLLPDGLGKVVTESVLPDWPSVIEQGIVDDCLQPEHLHKYHQEQFYAINDIDNSAVSACLIDFLKQFGVKAKLVVPILQKAELWGLMIVHQCDRPRQWSSFEIDLLQQLANQVGIALAQAQLVEALQQAQKELRQALDQEKELRELKSRFVSMASHEFRTPLTTILVSSDLLRCFAHKLSEEQKLKQLLKIQTEVKNMTGLLNDVLLIGKAEAGKIEFNPVTLDLEELCRDALAEIEFTASSTHTFMFSCQGNRTTAKMDEKLLRQMISNLLSNAVKYSPQGGTINLKLSCEAGQVTFQVQDQGIGIPQADQEHLFEAFHRASNVGTISGTGLGLAIIKNAVNLHGGSIAVKSEINVGTTFTICIPTIPRQGET